MKYLKKLIDKLLNITFGISILAVVWLLLQIFCVTSFRVPSNSMYPTIVPGDYMLVNKWIVGARIFDIWDVADGKEVKIYRLPGIRRVKRDDVLVFNFPYTHQSDSISMDLKLYYVKRCVALPGDTFSIRNAISLCELDLACYPNDNLIDWTVCNFGPMYIPKKGETIDMNKQHYVLYRSVIEWEQKKKLMMQNGAVCLGDSVINKYSFKENYYFMVGDNTLFSNDSRYWGLVPEPYIVGVATRVWKSVSPESGKVRWGRIMKKIE